MQVKLSWTHDDTSVQNKCTHQKRNTHTRVGETTAATTTLADPGSRDVARAIKCENNKGMNVLYEHPFYARRSNTGSNIYTISTETQI